MGKLTIQELEKLREKAREQLKLRTTGETRGKIIVHMGTCGISAGARDVLSALLEAIEKKGIKDIIVTTSGCAGMCSREPMATSASRLCFLISFSSASIISNALLDTHAVPVHIIRFNLYGIFCPP